MKIDPRPTGGQQPARQPVAPPVAPKPDVTERLPFGLIKSPPKALRTRGAPADPLPPDIAELVSLAGMSLSQIRVALDTLASHLPAPADRSDRAARWVLRGEVRKMAVLDRYLSGYIRG